MGKRREGLTPEQRAELDAMRAESATPGARAEEGRVRGLIEAEFPPAGFEALAALRLERERQDLSLADLSARTGIDPTALSRLERGRGNPTLATLERVAGALGQRVALRFVALEGGAGDRRSGGAEGG